MLIKLWCWLWGHKTVVKAMTGDTCSYSNQLTGNTDIGHYYRLGRLDFCVRCGRKVTDQ
jgi:hypothetical protein